MRLLMRRRLVYDDKKQADRQVKKPMFDSMDSAIRYIFQTRRRLDAAPRGLDEDTRDVSLTRRLLMRAKLPGAAREYVVVTGSRGKGSVTSIMAKLLQALGHRVGMITSPHLVHWNERIRINGRMISDDDFRRHLSALQAVIDPISAELGARQYLSPQGIFLAIALSWFDENQVNVAVLEVGRGGRFDDVSAVHNPLAVFTPIMLEHTALLGAALERIAWHKAGIIAAGGDALSLPQAPTVMDVLRQEADQQAASLACLDESDMARWVADRGDGQVIQLRPYGQLFLPLLGRHQIENASLAIRAVERVQARLSAAGAEPKAIREGLARVRWLGRIQKLQDHPTIYVDGAIMVRSAEAFVASVKPQLRQPVAAIVGIPHDRDYAGVYAVMAKPSQSLVITETDINPNTRFPRPAAALKAARRLGTDLHYAENLTRALKIARGKTGAEGTILLAVSLMLVGECMLIWGVDTSVI